MERRRFLERVALAAAGATVGVAAPGGAWAIGPRQKLRIARLRHSGRWNTYSGAGATLAEELQYRTSVDVAPEEVPLDPSHPRMAELPAALLAGDGAFHFADAERAALKRWLELGGLLFADNNGRSASGAPSEAFDRSLRRELELMFPRTPVEKVSPEHVLFRSFYRLDYPAGREIRKPFVEGLRLGRRYAVLISHNDLLGALARSSTGRFLHVPTPGGESQREMAVRFGVNVLMYGMCLHYKDDQVHLDYLLRRRKWKINRPE